MKNKDIEAYKESIKEFPIDDLSRDSLVWIHQQAITKAREEGEKRGLEKSQVVLDEMMQQAREEERKNIPVGFLRQFINERTPEEHKNLLTNEDIMRFINIGYKE